jgi:hypothetical protein
VSLSIRYVTSPHAGNVSRALTPADNETRGIRARMWQRAYPWWGLKPEARLRYVLLHVLYFFLGATIYTIWALLLTLSPVGQPGGFTVAGVVSGFVKTWTGAVVIGALLMVPPRAIAYVWHAIEKRNRPATVSPSDAPLAPATEAPPTTGSSDESPQ